MPLRFGLHTGPQNVEVAELQRLWRRADEAGFYWVSVWDHLYANPLRDRTEPCFEAVATMAALAATTRHVRVACLVFCVPFRNPALLAKAVVTIDHLSGGRAELGLGAGWLAEEFLEFGYRFPTLGERLDQLEEAVQIVRALLREGTVTFEGRHFRVAGAVCAPRPLQPRLRIWLGGSGRRRTPRLAARYADGFNVPFVSPAGFRERTAVLDRECERLGRDPRQIMRTVNLGFYMGADAAAAAPKREEVARLDEERRPGMLVGTPREVIGRLEEYAAAGVEGVNLSIRPPVDWDALEAFVVDVMPSVR